MREEKFRAINIPECFAKAQMSQKEAQECYAEAKRMKAKAKECYAEAEM